MTDKTQKQAAPKKPTGRPSSFSQEVADIICIRLGGGESLRKIIKTEGMPSQQTVYTWLQKYPAFLEQYTRAREEQAETHADEIVDIADETPDTTEVTDKEGNVIGIKLDSAYIAWQKQRIDARKWNASKQRPKKYGDKLTHSGDDVNPVVVENNHNVFGELLKNLKMQRQAEQ
jgi:transposase